MKQPAVVRIAILLAVAFAAARLLADENAWKQPTPPFHIVGPIYYVGTEGLAVYLIVTPEGCILLNGAVPGTAPLIEASIRKLGQQPQDIKILLISHAHSDHVGTLADLKKATGAKVEVVAAEADLLKSGGARDYLFANDRKFHFTGVAADRSLNDGDTVSLGGIQLTAHLAPGHTRGTTVWTTTVRDAGHSYSVVFSDGTGINPGTRFVKNPSYPGIANDYRRTLAFLATLHPDIWLAYHTESFDLAAKRDRAVSEGVKAWIDPDGYSRWLAAQTANFEKLVAQQTAQRSAP